MSGLSRLDTYLDVCFVVIACHCRSALYLPAASTLGLSMFLTQMLPSALAAFRATPDFRIVCKWSELQLSAEIIWVKLVRGNLLYDQELADQAVLSFYGTSLCRMLMHDLPMVVIQLVFLCDGQGGAGNSTVVASIIVASILSVDTTIKWVHANLEVAAATARLESPKGSPKARARGAVRVLEPAPAARGVTARAHAIPVTGRALASSGYSLPRKDLL